MEIRLNEGSMLFCGICFIAMGVFSIFEAIANFEILTGNSQAQLWLRLFGVKKAQSLCFLLGFSLMIWGTLLLGGMVH